MIRQPRNAAPTRSIPGVLAIAPALGFNIGALAVILNLIAQLATWWQGSPPEVAGQRSRSLCAITNGRESVAGLNEPGSSNTKDLFKGKPVRCRVRPDPASRAEADGLKRSTERLECGSSAGCFGGKEFEVAQTKIKTSHDVGCGRDSRKER